MQQFVPQPWDDHTLIFRSRFASQLPVPRLQSELFGLGICCFHLYSNYRL